MAQAELVSLIRELFDDSDGNYGVPRIYQALRRAGLAVNYKRVERLMRVHGMAGRHRRRNLRTTIPGPDGYRIPDLVERRFDPGAPDVAWVQDITYVATSEGWLYQAGVLDLGSRRLLGYSMADHMRTELVTDALTMALGARGGKPAVAGCIADADRGTQYTSNDYLDFCADKGCDRRSAGPVSATTMLSRNRSGGPSNGNAFWIRSTRPGPRPGGAVFRWINWYNNQKLHTTLDSIPPIYWETKYRKVS